MREGYRGILVTISGGVTVGVAVRVGVADTVAIARIGVLLGTGDGLS